MSPFHSSANTGSDVQCASGVIYSRFRSCILVHSGSGSGSTLNPMLRIRDFYPRPRIQHAQQEGWKTFLSFFEATNFTELKIIYFEQVQKKCEPVDWRIIVLFNQQLVFKLSKIWVADPGKPIPDHGSRGQKGTGSWTRNTAKTGPSNYSKSAKCTSQDCSKTFKF